MKISILTLFPEMFNGPFDSSIVKRAQTQKKLELNFVNLRDFGLGKYKQVDDRPYGGGVGMIMRVDVIASALASPKSKVQSSKFQERIILLDPKGKTFNQAMARKYAKLDHLILICGHYEGVDARVNKLVDESISVGDYILTGGEIPTMVIVDSVTRLLLGVLSKPEAIKNESFSHPTSHIPHPTLEYPQYTRPEEFQGLKVPKVLLSGNPKKIKEWQRSVHPMGVVA